MNRSIHISWYGLVNQIRKNGDDLTYQKVLRCFPKKIDEIVVVIEESKDLSNYSIDELVGSFNNYEDMINMNDNTSLDHAFKTKMTSQKGKGRGNIGFKGRGRGRNNFQREERKSRDPRGRIKPNLSSRGCNNNQSSQRYGK